MCVCVCVCVCVLGLGLCDNIIAKQTFYLNGNKFIGVTAHKFLMSSRSSYLIVVASSTVVLVENLHQENNSVDA